MYKDLVQCPLLTQHVGNYIGQGRHLWVLATVCFHSKGGVRYRKIGDLGWLFVANYSRTAPWRPASIEVVIVVVVVAVVVGLDCGLESLPVYQ